MRRNSGIDAVRLLANYLVVLIHAFAAFQYCAKKGMEFKAWQFLCNGVGSVALPALFIISGYLLLYGARTADFKWWKEKMFRRVRRLAVPYLAWNLAFVAIYLALAAFVPRLESRVSSYGLNTFRGVCEKVMDPISNPIDMPLWYLRTIFLYAFLSPVIVLLLRIWRGVIAYALIVAYWLISSRLGFGYSLEFTYPAYSLLLFVGGAHLAVKGFELEKVLTHKCLLPIALVGMMGLGLLFVDHWWDYSIWRDVAFVAATPLLFFVSKYAGKKLENSGTLKFLKSASFFVYCAHFLFCSILLHMCAPFLQGMGIGKFTLLVMIFCIPGVGLSLTAYAVGRRLLGGLFRIFDGTC